MDDSGTYTITVVGSAPNWAEIVTAIGSLLAGGTLLVGVGTAFFALRQIAEARRDRQVQIIAELGRRWDEDQLVEARAMVVKYDNVQLADKVARALEGTDTKEYLELLRVPNYFEDLALMAESGGLERDLVRRAFGPMVTRTWDYWELAIAKMREGAEESVLSYSEFERLRNDLLEDVAASRKQN